MSKRKKAGGVASPPAPKRHTGIVVAAIVVAALAVFAQARTFELLSYDDGTYVTKNPIVRDGITAHGVAWAFGMHASNWHPLTWLSLMLDAQIGGLSPAVFHATSVLWHLAASLLLFFSLRRMTGAVVRSGFVAVLFAVHPLHVESVAWVAERKDVLSAFFWFLTMLAWAWYAERPGPRRYAWAAASFGLGLMAKPMLVTLPAVLLLLDFWPLRRSGTKRLLLEKLPLVAMSAASAAVTLVAQSTGGATARAELYPLSERLQNAATSCAAYVGRTFWPFELSFFYPHPHGTLDPAAVAIAAAGLLAVTLAAVLVRRRAPYVTVGWLWYLVTLVPVIGLVQVGIQARADRYTYLPLVGLFLAVVWGAHETVAAIGRKAAVSWERAAVATGASIVLALAAIARTQAGYWKDNESLYRRALAIRPDNAVAHVNLATALLERDDLRGAEEHAREAERLDPGHPEPPIVLGNALARQGKVDEAIRVYRDAIALRPTDPLLRSNLGAFLGERGQLGEAAAELGEAIRLAPEDPEIHLNMGVLLARGARYREAAEEFSEALRLDPGSVEARENLERVRALERR